MAEEDINQELSLDDIFSRRAKEKDLREKEISLPFKFLDSYTREDKNIFFGRDSETDEIFKKFYSGKLLLVYGKSGTGKSSIINCGLISRIPDEDLYAISVRCGKKAQENLLSEIKKHTKTASDNPLEILEDIFFEHSKPVVLIFDQFEEIFIMSDDEEKESLAKTLNEILKSRLKINIVLIIREEYFANLTEFESLIPTLYGNRVRVEKMSKSSAIDAIVKPCQICNVGIEDGLADKIIAQLASQTEGLELTWLQILMDKLYRIALAKDPANPVIKHEDFERLGRIGNVLSNFLDEQVSLMPNREQGEALLKTMISTEGTKKLLTLNEISESLESSGHPLEQSTIEDILRHFIKVRIISDKDEQGNYELRHDAIAARIYERMTALEKELIEVKNFLDNSYKIYAQRKVLLTDNDLNYIALFENKLILNNDLKEFIRLSRKEVHRVRIRRRNIAIAATAVLMIVLTGFTLWALNERGKAVRQGAVAEEQKNEALQANLEAEKARSTAIDGENRAKENEARAIEQQKIAEEQRRVAMIANTLAEQSRNTALEERDRAESNEKLAIAARQDAEKSKNEAINASNQAQLYLYLFNGKELANKSLVMQGDNYLRALLSLSAFDLYTYGYEKFSPPGTQLTFDNELLEALQKSDFLFEKDSLTGGEIWSVGFNKEKVFYSNYPGELNVSVLDNSNQKRLPVLKSEAKFNLQANSLVMSLALDPQKERLAIGTTEGNVILFSNINSGTANPEVLYNSDKTRVWYLTFVPDKNWLISTSADKKIRIWDLTEQKIVKELDIKADVKKFVIINSRYLIFPGSLGQILRLDINNTDLDPQVIYSTPRLQPINTVAYDPGNKWLVASSSGEILVFLIPDQENLSNLTPMRFTMRHKGVITHMEFSPDNDWLLTASSDALMLWNLKDSGRVEIDKYIPVVIENNRQVFSLNFTEDSKYFVYSDYKMLHIYPVDIRGIYSRLKLIMGNRELNDQEWKYYVKGNLIRPGTK